MIYFVRAHASLNIYMEDLPNMTDSLQGSPALLLPPPGRVMDVSDVHIRSMVLFGARPPSAGAGESVRLAPFKLDLFLVAFLPSKL
jgi:hypothetical protein